MGELHLRAGGHLATESSPCGGFGVYGVGLAPEAA